MTCSTCRLWHPAEQDMAPLGECWSEALIRGYHRDARRVPRNGALVENDEGWGILTGPEFGCVHYEPKETVA